MGVYLEYIHVCTFMINRVVFRLAPSCAVINDYRYTGLEERTKVHFLTKSLAAIQQPEDLNISSDRSVARYEFPCQRLYDLGQVMKPFI